MLVRYGLLAFMVNFYAFLILFSLPVSTDTSAFYFGYGLFGIAVVMATSLSGVWISLGCNPLFGKLHVGQRR